ncbi:MAG: hypothetical protein KDA45_14660, partial [Planctomycetales bacterium]|nr:hypothetical protein [Planctomycetales bacterium]
MLLGFTLSNSLIIPLAAFVAFGAVTWLLLSHFFMARDDRAEQRLVELSDPRGKRGDDREAKKSEAISRVLQRASPTLAKPLTPTNEKDMGKLRQDLIEAGFRSESAPLTYLAIRGGVAIAFLIMGGGVSLLLYGFT